MPPHRPRKKGLNMKRVFLASIVLGAFPLTALAAGPLESDFAPVLAVSSPWAGMYSGITIGKNSNSYDFSDGYVEERVSGHHGGKNIGLVSGYNWRNDFLVYGVEAEFNILDYSTDGLTYYG